jgi:hypothetical protein
VFPRHLANCQTSVGGANQRIADATESAGNTPVDLTAAVEELLGRIQ